MNLVQSQASSCDARSNHSPLRPDTCLFSSFYQPLQVLCRRHSPEAEEDRQERAGVSYPSGLGRGGRGPQGRRTRSAHGQERHLQIERLQARAEDMNERVGEFLKRTLGGECSYRCLDAICPLAHPPEARQT